MWIADVKNEWGDKARYPVIANAKDLDLFKKVLKSDTYYMCSELHSGWICLTKKSGKELQERLLTPQEQELFKEAKLLEIQNLEGTNAIEFVTDREEIARVLSDLPHRVMPSRFIITKKMQEVGQAWKAKARWILLGHRDPDALKVERYAPTPATTTVYMTFQILASLRYRLTIMDVSSAFGQSEPEEREDGPLYATMKPTGIPGKDQGFLIRVRTAVYGLVNAPASWRRTVRKFLLSLDYRESSFDPCLYYLEYTAEDGLELPRRGCAGVVLLDVDDFVQGGNKRHQQKMQALREHFKFGKWRDVFQSYGEYLGRTVIQKENFEVNICMSRYIREKLRPIILPRGRAKEDDSLLDEKETSLLRGAGGSLLWVGKEARPDMAASCAMVLSWEKEGPKVSHVKQANKAIQELQRTAETSLRILPIALEDGFWMSISDASLGNDGNKSQGGFLIAFADKKIKSGELADFSLNSWRSHRLRRVVKASLGSEALAMDDALAELEWVRALYSEVCIPGTTVFDGTRLSTDERVAVVRQSDEKEESITVTDAKALYDLFHRRSGSAGLDRRAQIDVAVMCHSAKVLNAKVHWLPGHFMLADPLTKRLGNSKLLRSVMHLAKYAIQEDALRSLMHELSEEPPDGCKSQHPEARQLCSV